MGERGWPAGAEQNVAAAIDGGELLAGEHESRPTVLDSTRRKHQEIAHAMANSHRAASRTKTGWGRREVGKADGKALQITVTACK
jgi:hypothetical protein